MRTDPRDATLNTEKPVYPPARAAVPHVFGLWCADVHAAVPGAGRAGDVVALAREHGALVHGFTSVCCGPQRLGLMAAVTRPDGGAR
jgi:hypothetical protein